MIRQKNGTRLVGLSTQESAIRSQIEGTERRAEKYNPKCNKNSMRWKWDNQLLDEQTNII